MADDLVKISRVDGVEHIEEEGSIRNPSLQELVREIHGQLLVTPYHLYHVFDGKLIEPWDDDVFHVSYLQHFLLVHEYQLDEVLIDLMLWWKHVLTLNRYGMKG